MIVNVQLQRRFLYVLYMRTMFDAVAKPITSRIELCRATAPTALPMDHATEADNMEPNPAHKDAFNLLISDNI